MATTKISDEIVLKGRKKKMPGAIPASSSSSSTDDEAILRELVSYTASVRYFHLTFNIAVVTVCGEWDQL